MGNNVYGFMHKDIVLALLSIEDDIITGIRLNPETVNF